MTNKISLLYPGLWHDRAVNLMEQCARVKSSARPIKQVAANTLVMGTGAIAGVSQVAKFVFVQPVGMALTAAIGLVRVLTWSDCLSRAYRALPGPMDWLRTAGKIVAYTLSIPVSALAAVGSLLGSKSSHLNVRYQKKFICTPLQKKSLKSPVQPKVKQPHSETPAAPLPLAQPRPVAKVHVPLDPPQHAPNPPAALSAQGPALPAPLAQPAVVPAAVLPAPLPLAPAVAPPAAPAAAPVAPAAAPVAPAVAPAVPAAAPVAPPPAVAPQSEILTIERVTAFLVPPAIGLYAVGKTLSLGASLVKSAAGGAWSLLSSAASLALPAGVKNATVQTVTQSSMITPLVLNVTATAVPYLTHAALWALKGTAQQVVQNQFPVAAPFLNGTLACLP
ncbi:MAG: hypothetical protein LLG04_09545 [Parachlamydia sp.]|nr:hypothetical protein [Parachlamydia sp.]